MITNPIEIQLSKKKLILLLCGAIAFVAIGFWFVISPIAIQYWLFGNPTLVLIAGIAAIIFFGFCGFIIIKKLKENNPGLIIDSTGITDNSSGISAGHIPWNDIKAIEPIKVINQKLLMILVSNPEKYINQQTNILKRKTAEMNYKNYGSPISISANTLNCNFDKLNNILQSEFNRNRTKAE